jgi:hypothetical protein
MSSNMEAILEQIEQAVEAEFYYVALLMSLSLPEICGRMEREQPSAGRSREIYADWFCTYLGEIYPKMKGDDCYYLRCGLAHHGQSSHKSMGYSRIVFTLKDENFFIHNNVLNDALNLHCPTFCHDMCDAVRRWMQAKENDKMVTDRLDDMVALRPEGMAPYIVGRPVIS